MLWRKLMFLLAIVWCGWIGSIKLFSLLLLLIIYLFDQTSILAVLKLIVWITIFSWKEPSLSLSFPSLLNCSIFWCWTFTFSKMNNTFKSSWICYILLVMILLLLLSQSLLKLHLLLHFLLFIRQYRMLTSLIWLYLLAWYLHTESLLMFVWRSLYWLGVWSWIGGSLWIHLINVLALLHHIILNFAWIYWWICIWMEGCVWHTLILFVYILTTLGCISIA